MNNEQDGAESRKTLRTDAESMLSSLSPDEKEAKPTEILLHELMLHKVELEMQNEELRKTHLAMEAARDRYWHLYEFSPMGYITITREAMISEINLKACTMLGANRTKIINHRFVSAIASHEQDRWHRFFLNFMEREKNEKETFDVGMLRKDGSIFCAHLDCMRLKIEDTPPLLRIAITDITQLKKAEADLRIAAIVFESKEPMMVTDSKAAILRVNQAFINITGYSAGEIVGKTPSLLKSGRHSYEFYNAMWKSINHQGFWEGEIWNKRKNGEIYTEWLYITAVKNESGEVTNYVGVSSSNVKKTT